MSGGFLAPLKLAFQFAGEAAQAQEEFATNQFNQAELARSQRLSEGNAFDAMAQGAIRAGAARMKASDAQAEQEARAAAAGFFDSGSIANVRDAIGFGGEAEAMAIENNAARAAFGHREVARGYGLKAQQMQRQYDAAQANRGWRMAGEFAEAAGDFTSTLLGAKKLLGAKE